MYLGNDILAPLGNHRGGGGGVVQDHPQVGHRDIAPHKVLYPLHVAAPDGRLGHIVSAGGHAQLDTLYRQVGHIQPEEYQHYYIADIFGILDHLQQSTRRQGRLHAKVRPFFYEFVQALEQDAAGAYRGRLRFAG